MDETKPHLTIVDSTYTHSDWDEEFAPLPHYPWDERPSTFPLDHDEAATAIHLADGDILVAARTLKVPIVRLQRLIRGSPRLQRILDEALGVSMVLAAHVPLATLHDPNADHRRLEWAATKLLQSRMGAGHPLSPAPAISTVSASLEAPRRTLTFRWRTDADDDNRSGGAGGSE